MIPRCPRETALGASYWESEHLQFGAGSFHHPKALQELNPIFRVSWALFIFNYFHIFPGLGISSWNDGSIFTAGLIFQVGKPKLDVADPEFIYFYISVFI